MIRRHSPSQLGMKTKTSLRENPSPWNDLRILLFMFGVGQPSRVLVYYVSLVPDSVEDAAIRWRINNDGN
jgi:hypothetical protein